DEGDILQRKKAAMAAMALPFETYENRAIEPLSTGEKRRVAIAGVIAMAPEILALDEPTAGLDMQASQALIKYLQQYHARQHKGLVIASHNIDFLLQTVNRFLILREGELVADLERAELGAYITAGSPGVATPRAMRLAEKLREMGIPLPECILSEQQLLQALDD
ncbi:MAG: ATP-binding cassette domain-containing protein, partial [Calditrichaeota bacterium]